MTYIETAIELIKEAEGFIPDPYICPAGELTQGYGRNLEVHPLSDRELLLNPDGSVSEVVASGWVRDEVLKLLEYFSDNEIFKQQSGIRRALLIDIAFNIGYVGLMKFQKMWKALEASDYAEAARQLKDSKWYHQVGRRGRRNYTIMATGDRVHI